VVVGGMRAKAVWKGGVGCVAGMRAKAVWKGGAGCVAGMRAKAVWKGGAGCVSASQLFEAKCGVKHEDLEDEVQNDEDET